VERATSLARREGADARDRLTAALNWAGATLAGAAFGFDPQSLRLREALVKNGVVGLGTGEIALLRHAYALEQLEAAFYTAVMASPYSGMTRYEPSVLRDVKGHEIAHREFIRKPLGNSVLRTVSMFEDLGVSAYNSARC
jgi:Ferritin-like domain